MTAAELFLAVLTLFELALLVLVVRFFSRLRKSEELLSNLREQQGSLLKKLTDNAELERDLVNSFARRQRELAALNEAMEERRRELEKLLKKAEEFTRSPAFMRQMILSGKKRGQSNAALAKATGLSVEEVELILSQA